MEQLILLKKDFVRGTTEKEKFLEDMEDMIGKARRRRRRRVGGWR
jgi:hypothetical protein